MNKTLLFVAASVVLVVCPWAAEAAGPWDLVSEYSKSSNPSGQWTYLAGQRGMAVPYLDSEVPDFGGSWTIDPGGASTTGPDAYSGDASNPNNNAYMMKNVTGSDLMWGTNAYLADGKVGVGPAYVGGHSNDAVVSWLSPINGYVDISTTLERLQDPGGDGQDFYIDLNGIEVTSGSLAGTVALYDSITLSPISVPVMINDVINIGVGANADRFYDFAGLSATITEGVTLPPTVYPTGPWNFADQYSATSNLYANTWSYRSGLRDSPALLLNAIADFGTAVGNTWTADPPAGLVTGPSAWAADETYADAYIIKNETAGDLIWSGNSYHPVDSVTVGPSENDDAVITWLSPYTGWVDITAEFEARQTNAGSDGITYYVDLNNTAGQLLTGGLAGAGAPVGTTSGTLATTVEVVAGDQINFGVNANTSQAWDVTRVYGTITVGTGPPTPTVYPTGPWNFADQYSATSNLDANTWSYRSGISSNKTTSSLLPGTVGDPLVQSPDWDGASDGWGNTAGSVWNHPYFIKNDSASAKTWYGTSIPAGKAFGAPSSAEDAVVSWLAPSAMTVDISMDLTWLEDHGGGNGVDWFITLNDTPLVPGDANEDGRVDEDDAAILAANWQTIGGATLADGDFNSDGNVDDLDATLMAANWGQLGAGVLLNGTFGDVTSSAGESTGIQSVLGVSVLAGDVIKLVIDSKGNGGWDAVLIDFDIAVSAAAVPEPSVCVLLAGMLLMLVARRRR